MKKEINIWNDVRSAEVQEIIGKPPSKIVMYGNLLTLIILIIFLAGAAFIKYPDIVSAPVTIISTAPPINIVAMTSGRINDIMVENNSRVAENQAIATIDNSANTQDVLLLKNFVDKIDTSIEIKDLILKSNLPDNLQVGEIQAGFSELYQAIDNFRFVSSNNYYSDKKALIDNQNKLSNDIVLNTNKRKKALNEQLRIENWKDSINKILVKEKVISPSEYNAIRKEYLSQNINSADNVTNSIQYELQIKEYQKSIADLSQQHLSDEANALNALKSTVQKVRGQISIWEKKYIITSPITGRIVFFKVWKKNQFVTAGDRIFVVVPMEQYYEVRAQLPVYSSGKVKINQKVLIKLQEYPYAEFGMLIGKVNNVTNVSLDSMYLAKISLVNGLHTTLNKQIPIKPQISGTADIITKDKSIFQRLFEGIYGNLYEN